MAASDGVDLLRVQQDEKLQGDLRVLDLIGFGRAPLHHRPSGPHRDI
jgi:hypothetical protein